MIKSSKDYKKNQIKNRCIILISQLSLLLIFLLSWELLAKYQIINEFLLSRPSSIIKLFILNLEDGTLLNHLSISTLETLIALTISTTLGIFLSILIFSSKLITKILDPFLTVLNSIPKSASGIIFIIWFGTSYKGIIAVSISFSIIISVITCLNYFKSIDIDYLKMAKTMGATKFQLLTKIILPASLDNILTLIKVNIGLSWVGVVVGEFLVSKKGIGYLILYGGQVFKMDLVMMGILILSFIALGMSQLINLLQKIIRKFVYHYN